MHRWDDDGEEIANKETKQQRHLSFLSFLKLRQIKSAGGFVMLVLFVRTINKITKQMKMKTFLNNSKTSTQRMKSPNVSHLCVEC